MRLINNPNPPTPDDLLREQAVARLLDVSVFTLQGWRKRGDGPPFVRMSHNAIRYRRADILEWVAKRRTGGAP